MKLKKIAAFFAALVTLNSSLSALADGVSVFVNGQELQSDAIMVEDDVYVSLNEITQSLGGSVAWDDAAQSANVELSADTLVVSMIEKVSESVVAIVGNYKDSSLSSDAQDYNELYAHGAGAVIDSEGVILTNAHVVDEIQNLTVIFGNGKTYPGTVLYSDETSDLAVVKINKQNLTPITFATEDSLKVGETVVAIGTPLSVNLINSATKGIVSGIGVNIGQHYLFTQSDVAINGGNSGGPLVNMKGELVGVNSIKYVGSEIEGMSFSIPVDTINYVLDSFKNYGRVIRPDTGVTLTESWESKIGVPTTKGLTVTASENELLAAGDMVTHVNGYEVHSIADYNEALKKSFDGESVVFTYTRGGVSAQAEITTEVDFSKETGGRVEISFIVGSSSLMINGFVTEVETPYIAGDGTTLVPLRVITEAFGAQVEWVNDTQEIVLDYPDINITLQIGNKDAAVNGETVTLPEAPVLKDGVTMVPLRFISEQFGATVTFDNESARITVIREAEEESGTIKFSTEMPRVGDSYWNWSMLTPTSMMMNDRSLDGTSTMFYDDDGFLDIAIYDYENDDYYDDYTEEELFEEIYDEAMYYTFEDLTLSKDEKGTDSLGNNCFRLTGRSKTAYYDCYTVVRGKTVFEVSAYCMAASTQLKTYTSILESFKVEFAANEDERAQTYDLSNVDEEGYRIMKDEELKVSFRVPADFSEGSTGYYSINTLEYTNNDGQYIQMSVYSKSDTVKAQTSAEDDRDFEQKYKNPEYCTVSEVMEYEADFGENIYYYTIVTTDNKDDAEEETEEAPEPEEESKDDDYVIYVMFFEKGEYVYELCICSEKDEDEFFGKVMESFEAEELDSDEMGIFMRQEKNFNEKKFGEGNWAITLDSSWSESYAYEDYAMYRNSHTAASLYLEIAEAADVDYTSAKSAADSALKSAKEYYDEVEVIQGVTQVNFGNNSFYMFSFKAISESYYSDEKITEYYTAYVMKKGGKFYAFELTEQEEYANAQTKLDVEAALATFTIE